MTEMIQKLREMLDARPGTIAFENASERLRDLFPVLISIAASAEELRKWQKIEHGELADKNNCKGGCSPAELAQKQFAAKEALDLCLTSLAIKMR